jgi:hypothetical protein
MEDRSSLARALFDIKAAAMDLIRLVRRISALRRAPVAGMAQGGNAGPAPGLQQTVTKLLASRIRAVMSPTGRLDEQRDAGFIGSLGTPFARRVVTASAAPLARDRLGWRMRSWPAPRCASSHGRHDVCANHMPC